VRELTDGRGVDCVVEIGGPGTIAMSLKALAVGGHVSLIGASLTLSGTGLDPLLLTGRGITLGSISVGSRADFEAMNRAIAMHRRFHAVSTASVGLFGGFDQWRRTAGGSLVDDDLTQILDAVFGECGHAILTYAVDPEAAVFGEHVDRQLVQPVFVLAEQVGDVADREDGCNRCHDQAA
jgi:hypothetical protein